MKKRVVALVMAMVMVFAVGCSQSETANTNNGGAETTENTAVAEDVETEEVTEEVASESKGTIGISYALLNVPFCAYQSEKFIEIGEDLGYEIILMNADNNSEKQIADVEDLISKGVDAIFLHPVDSEACGPLVDEINEAGIDLVVVNRGVTGKEPGVDYVAYCGGDNKKQGALAYEYINEHWADFGFEGSKKAVHITGPLSVEDAVLRGEGFTDMAEEDSDWEIVATQTANWGRVEAQQVMQNIIQSTGGDFNVVYSHNDEMIFGVIAALKEAGMQPGVDVITVGIDTPTEACEAIQAGELTFEVNYDPANIARAAFESYEKYIAGEEFNLTPELPIYAVDTENVQEVLDSGTLFY